MKLKVAFFQISATILLFLQLSLPAGSQVSIEKLEASLGEFENGEFEKIDENLYRSGQPTKEGFKLLKASGIRTVINFRHEAHEIEVERRILEDLGMNYVSLPWRIQWHPEEPVMKQFLQIVAQKEKGPFLIHCRRGAERTGVADALYRHVHEGLSADEAYEKAMAAHNTRWIWRPFAKRRYNQFLRQGVRS